MTKPLSATKAFAKTRKKYISKFRTMVLVGPNNTYIPLCGLRPSDVWQHEYELWQQLKAQFYGLDNVE